SNPRPCVTFLILVLSSGLLLWQSLRADDLDHLKVGQQSDGRIVVPTNQVLQPAGRQILFPGRPVDLVLIDEGQTLVVKSMRALVFIETATGKIKQTLPSPVGFSVIGLLAQGERIYATDVRDHIRIAVRQDGGRYAWENPIQLGKPGVGGTA